MAGTRRQSACADRKLGIAASITTPLGIAWYLLAAHCGDAAPTAPPLAPPSPSERPAPVSALSAAASAPAASDAITRCRAAQHEALVHRDDDPGRAAKKLLRACAAIYAEQDCRDAHFLAADPDTDPSQRVRIFTEACAHAYCPLLPEPRPAMCRAQGDLDFAQRAAAWAELNRAILVHDHGRGVLERLMAPDDAAATPEVTAGAGLEDAGSADAPAVTAVGAWRRRSGCTLSGPSGTTTDAAIEVYVARDLIAVDGREVARGAALELAKVARIDALFTAMNERRAERMSRHPEQAYPGDAVLYVERDVPALLVKSVFQTAAFAGHPNLVFVTCPDTPDGGAP